MSTGKAPKKNNYALKNEMDLNFPTQFGKKFERDNFYSTPPFLIGCFCIIHLIIESGYDDQQLSLSYSTLCVW